MPVLTGNIRLSFSERAAKVCPRNRQTPLIIPADLPRGSLPSILRDQQSITVNETQTAARDTQPVANF